MNIPIYLICPAITEYKTAGPYYKANISVVFENIENLRKPYLLDWRDTAMIKCIDLYPINRCVVNWDTSRLTILYIGGNVRWIKKWNACNLKYCTFMYGDMIGDLYYLTKWQLHSLKYYLIDYIDKFTDKFDSFKKMEPYINPDGGYF